MFYGRELLQLSHVHPSLAYLIYLSDWCCNPHQNFRAAWHIELGIGRVCHLHGREMCGKCQGRGKFGNLGVDGKVIQRHIKRPYDVT